MLNHQRVYAYFLFFYFVLPSASIAASLHRHLLTGKTATTWNAPLTYMQRARRPASARSYYAALSYGAAKTGQNAFHVVTARIGNPQHSYVHRDIGVSIACSDKQTR
ncbi:hypothetical protein MTO96_030597 [Rhipicephalus appendiculatus]